MPFERKKWSYLEVVTAVKGADIDKLACELSGDKPGSLLYLQNYKKASRQIEEGLSDDERQKYMAMSKEWSEQAPPPRIQQRYAHGNDSSRLELTGFSTLV